MLVWLFSDLPTWFFGLLAPAQWDAWRNWLATIGGLAALTIATSTYRRNVKIKREEQARLVYSRLLETSDHEAGDTFQLPLAGAMLGVEVVSDPYNAGWGVMGHAPEPLLHAKVVIHNGSKELIGPARVQMVNESTGTIWEEFAARLDAIEPETDATIDFVWPNEVHPSRPQLATTVIFRDASGQWWRRHRAEPVERVHDDPENYGQTATQRSNFRSQVGPVYIGPPEPKVTARVRWHRFWRKRRGLTPTP